MKNYNNYILEKLRDGTEQISDDKATKLIEGLKEFNWNDNNISRDLNYSHKNVVFPDILIIDPKQHNRKSANTKNYYTLIMDNHENWKNHPNRSNSLICTYNKVLKDERPLEDNFRIIPFDGSNWGYTYKADLWDCFYPGANVTCDALYDLGNYFKIPIRDDNYEEFVEDVNKLDDKLSKKNYKKFEKKMVYGSPVRQNAWEIWEDWCIDHSELSLIDYLTEAKFSPFSAQPPVEPTTYPKIIDRGDTGIECWTDSTCLLIRYKSSFYSKLDEKLSK